MKTLYQIGFSSLVLTLAWLATVSGVKWAANLITFWVWLNFVLGLLTVLIVGLMNRDEFAKSDFGKPRSAFMAFLQTGAGIALILLFAANGWFFAASVCACWQFLGQCLRLYRKKIESEVKQEVAK